MKKSLYIALAFIFTLTLAACSEEENTEEQSMTTYESEEGPVEVYENPEKIVSLSSFLTGHALHAGGNVVGATSWDFLNQTYETHLEDASEVSEENVEGILALEPDLIIAQPGIANLDQIKEIAPTVVFTYGSLTYLEQYVEVATLLGNRDEAQTWVSDFQEDATTTGEAIKAEYGEDISVSVIESYGKELYVYGSNWGRGTEILYQEMELTMPEKVEEDALEPGYFALSSEVLPEYMGDFVVLSKHLDAETAFEDTSGYQNTDAYQEDRILEVDGTAFSYNDPLTLEWQLETFKEFFLNE